MLRGGDKMNNDAMNLKREIAGTHMMLEELQLYLNTHPNDRNALAKRNAFVKQMKILNDEYNKNFGMITQDASLSTYPWQWIDGPWPWEYEANFEI